MDRFLTRNGQPSSSSDTTRKRPAEGDAAPARAGARRAKPRRSKLRLPERSKGAARALGQRSNTDPGPQSLLDRVGGRPVATRQLGNLNLLQRARDEDGFTQPVGPATRERHAADAQAQQGSGSKGEAWAHAVVAAASTASAAVASAPPERGNLRRQGEDDRQALGRLTNNQVPSDSPRDAGAGAAAAAATDIPPPSAKEKRPALAPIPRADRVTDFFPRMDLSARAPVPGRPSDSTTWTGRYPLPSPPPGDSGDSGSGEDADCFGSDGDYYSSVSRTRRRRRRQGDHEAHDDEAEVRREGGAPRSRSARDNGGGSRDGLGRLGGGDSGGDLSDDPRAGDAATGSRASNARRCGQAAAASAPTPLVRPAGASTTNPVAARAEASERAAAAAERRARKRTGVAETAPPPEEVENGGGVRQPETGVGPMPDGGLAAVEAPAATRDAGMDLEAAVEAAAVAATAEALELAAAAEVAEAVERAAEARPSLPEPCRRRHGMSALALTQRRSTGGRLGSGVVDAGKHAFRRRALSELFRAGLSTMRLRLGRVSGSRTGAGVVRGHPEGQGETRRESSGVSCLAFDSMGALLAAGAGGNVTVYDFDEYVPQIPRVKSRLEAGVYAYLQPTHCIQTKRAVSCVRWNPQNEDQVAVSFLHYDDIEVFDLQTVSPNAEATPVVTLLPGNVAPGAGGRGAGLARTGSFRGVVQGGSGASAASRASGRNRGLGNLSFEFVGRTDSSGIVMHVMACGRGGMFRVWRFAPKSARQLAPYLQAQLGVSAGRQSARPDVTAVCCISRDVALVGTDSGILAAYSLQPPQVKAFQSGKMADRLELWSLDDRRVWPAAAPVAGDSGSGGRGTAPWQFRISSLRLSPTHGAGVVVCGLRCGRVVVFDTRAGRALGLTRPDVPPTNVGYCEAGPHGGDWSKAILACSKSEVGEAQLLLLSTSARAALDSRRLDGGGRDSRLRPGPGWALGEAGGGGFRVEESSGYDLCLPIGVERATPGRGRVTLSRDARGYLCSRSQVHLLDSRLVTSSIMIGEDEHSVAAISADGTELVLDRRYRGPRVGPRQGAVSTPAATGGVSPPSTFEAGDNGRGVVSAADSSEVDEPGAGEGDSENPTRATLDPSDGRGGGAEADVPDPEGAAPVASGSSNGSAVAGCNDSRPADQMGEGSCEDEGTPVTASQEGWDRAWRPNGVRIFAKLKAVFPDGDGIFPETSAHAGSTQALVKASSLLNSGGSSDGSGLHRIAGRGQSSDLGGVVPLWSSLEVVGRAKLGLPATCITSHPAMNFILVGLSDGTIAAVLPGARKRKKRLPTETG